MEPTTNTEAEATNASADPKKKRTRRTAGFLDIRQLKAITQAEQVARTAGRAEHISRLQAREIVSAKLTALQAEATACRDLATKAVQSASRKSGNTAQESAARADVQEALREIQAAANQKYARTQPARLAEYYVGTPLNRASRATLLQITAAVIDALDAPSAPGLPGITPEKVAALKAKRELWESSNTTQTENQSDSTRYRAELAERLKTLTDLRLEIQFAADAEYPHTREGNHAVRTEFGLPANRPFRAR